MSDYKIDRHAIGPTLWLVIQKRTYVDNWIRLLYYGCRCHCKSKCVIDARFFLLDASTLLVYLNIRVDMAGLNCV